MKKKFAFVLMAIVLLPLLALFGCDEVSSYPVKVFTSSTTYGAVSGLGTYKEGDMVTLTATAKNQGRFIAWVYQNSLQLENNETYQIAKEDEASKKVSLTFKMTDKTQGNYTAVFDSANTQNESKVMYAKLKSYRFSSLEAFEANPNGETFDDDISTPLLNANLSFSHGQTSSNLVSVLSLENAELKNNLIYSPEKINQVLNLPTNSTQHFRVQVLGKIGNYSFSKDFRADLDFQKTTEKMQTTTYSYTVTYSKSEGTYTITFEFVDHGQTYFCIVTYENLK